MTLIHVCFRLISHYVEQDAHSALILGGDYMNRAGPVNRLKLFPV